MSYCEIEDADIHIRSESGVEVVVTRTDFPEDADGPAFTRIGWHVGYTSERENTPGEEPPASGHLDVGDTDGPRSHPQMSVSVALSVARHAAFEAAWTFFGVLITNLGQIIHEKHAPSVASRQRMIDKILLADDGAHPFRGVVMAKVDVRADDERSARQKMRQIAMRAGLEVEQVASVRNLAVRLESDGTNGPRKTISAQISSDTIPIPSVRGVGED